MDNIDLMENFFDKTYTVTLSDGTVIKNLKMNGNNFISREPLEESTFIGNCSPTIISDGETEEVHEHMELVQIVTFPSEEGDYWFVLRDLTKNELVTMEMQSNIEYIAMMASIDL